MPEREVKLGAPPGFRLPRFDDLAGEPGDTEDGIVAREIEDQRLVATYYDTPDFRLARWGASLRYRDPEGWTVKLAEESQGPLMVRGEYQFEGDPRRPPGKATDLLTAYLRQAPIAPVVRLRTLRRGLDLQTVGDGTLALVTDDEVSVMDRSRVAARFREVEVEIGDDTPPDVLSAVVERLRAAGAGAPDPTPKYVRAIGPRAQEPPEVTLDELDPDATAGDVIRHALSASVIRLLQHDAGVRLGEDPENVHQARVATRRLRSDLRTFGTLVDPEWAGSLRDELGWLGNELGTVRDADVMLGRLRDRVEALPPPERRSAAGLLARLEVSRQEAGENLLDAMRSHRYVELLDRLVAATRDPILLPEADAPAAESVSGLVAGPWKKLRKAARALESDPTDEALHKVRIRAKRCRYAAEAVAPVVGEIAQDFADAIARVQDVLGGHQDAVVAQAWLREASRGTTGRAAFVAGELTGAETAAAAQARSDWPKVWKKASRKRLRSWL
jgi:CHAD domain-containing protein